MSERQSKNQTVDLSEAKQPSFFVEREAKKTESKTVKSEQNFTHEREVKKKLAHKQNATAFIPGGSINEELEK